MEIRLEWRDAGAEALTRALARRCGIHPSDVAASATYGRWLHRLVATAAELEHRYWPGRLFRVAVTVTGESLGVFRFAPSGDESRWHGSMIGADRPASKAAGEAVVRFGSLDEVLDATEVRVDPLGRLVAGKLVVDAIEMSTSVDGKPCGLAPREVLILTAILEADGSVVTRRQLFDTAWDTGEFDAAAVQTCLRKIRSRLGDHRDVIEAVYGEGYRASPHREAGSRVRYQDLELDVSGRRASRRGVPLRLNESEWRLVTVFASRPGQALRYAELIDALGADRADARSVTRHVAQLRQKLGRHRIRTERLIGYTFVP
jgi:DNA-binding response OmpR family regulator